MEQYGQLLDDYEPEKNTLYSAIAEYFNDPVMTKTKDTEQYSIYMCKTQCMLANVCRYVVAMNKTDLNPVGTQINLSSMSWDSFQTRTLSGKYPNVTSCGYIPNKKGPLSAIIERISQDEKSSEYKCNNFSIKVTLINSKGSPAYQPKGTLISALETFNTVILFD